ncbi:uncharacterized protein BDW43DRAFT_246003 [Aspergillus alliaceus]|uniref:uncharacterized protein n=1 Tax=Petromyces alliaceus TaxID=209559 RepID=UPI0012A64F08|nr:uncharacterized protein BDW43DRAFT_246003 [Aspergillus alliaceus]KAB8227459.1 hypothetical protein BDW43DRAFT_246003 [Aspergillus alliaceus]
MSGSISQIMIDYLNDFVSSSIQFIVLTSFTLLFIRILHRTVFYPAYLTPLWALPTPPNRSWTRGSYTLAPVSSHIAHLRHWSATVLNSGLIRYYLPGNEERVLVTSVEALNDILVLKATHFVKPDVVRQRLSYIAGNGLLLAEGETHKVRDPIQMNFVYLCLNQSLRPKSIDTTEKPDACLFFSSYQKSIPHFLGQSSRFGRLS